MGTQHGMSALHFAANAGHLDVVKVLLAAKANIHALDEVPHSLRLYLSPLRNIQCGL
jgi:ankyrin repeat protein